MLLSANITWNRQRGGSGARRRRGGECTARFYVNNRFGTVYLKHYRFDFH